MELVESNFDYFAGGALMEPQDKKNDKTSIYELAKSAGYKVCFTQNDANSLQNGDKAIVVAETLADGDSMSYDNDRKNNEWALRDYVRKGIEVLDNKKGFFMMVEGGKVDWACHANDARSSIADTLALSAAVEEAIEFYNKHPKETLIIVTADHETGGLSLGSDESGYSLHWDIVEERYAAGDKLSKEERKALNSASGFDFTSVHHNAGNVPVYSIGKGFEAFCGRIDNTQIKNKILCRQ